MLNAHFDGKTVVLDEPHSLKTGTRLKVIVENESAPNAPSANQFRPLNIKIDEELSHAIALDPDFNVEEA